MLHYQIDTNSGVPVYRQIMDQIKYYISSGTLKPGQKLESIREMARKLSVNPTTIVKTYSELEHENVIEMKHGKGAFVSEKVLAISKKEASAALHRLARQIVVEANQMGVSAKELMKIMEKELKEINHE
ncbi:MAG: GntR family transcriptional regulator [Planctomycetota bacterium]|nr:MAG: GntR family transcriptional regulator [Planctomycetota bacterium]